jgi:hypothetical protein
MSIAFAIATPRIKVHNDNGGCTATAGILRGNRWKYCHRNLAKMIQDKIIEANNSKKKEKKEVLEGKGCD